MLYIVACTVFYALGIVSGIFLYIQAQKILDEITRAFDDAKPGDFGLNVSSACSSMNEQQPPADVSVVRRHLRLVK